MEEKKINEALDEVTGGGTITEYFAQGLMGNKIQVTQTRLYLGKQIIFRENTPIVFEKRKYYMGELTYYDGTVYHLKAHDGNNVSVYCYNYDIYERNDIKY